MDADRIAEILGLKPHPEGGFYRETYRSSGTIPAAALPERYTGSRSLGTAIYYLLTADTFSAFHRLRGDEALHFYLGDRAEVVMLDPVQGARTVALGSDLAAGERPQLVVPRGTWFAIRVADGGDYALLGTTMAPGFDYGDFELAERDGLVAEYPDEADLIRRLTR